ncbi:hypothetical protein Zmor_025085 [Zophobas morio]|uniref:Envelope fusion protein n=1 Tax=Zophobas morio TaxID=2755281 RepID=A0AA38HQT6_9CUCU|nr:hypothetical protein Zmor_025085 [Zophobas morio]
MSEIDIRPLENTIGLYYEKEHTIKITNDNWKLIVYKDLNLLLSAFQENKNILSNLQNFIFQLSSNSSVRLASFTIPLKPHVKFLDQIIKRIDNKFSEILLETPEKFRFKRGIIDGLGSIWKAITGNLDAADGEYIEQCINKLEKDDREIQNLIRNQIQVTTSTIHNFNYTIQKLQIDEITFNEDLKIIEKEINKIEDNTYYFNNQLKIISTCEQLLESLILIESELDDILESTTFAKLKILHPSIIKPETLLNQLSLISQHLSHNNLPLNPTIHNLPNLFNLITLQAYQTNKRIVFILRIPLVEKEKYTLFHLYSIPTKDTKLNIFHTIIPESRYVALAENNRQYLKLSSIERCKELQEDTLLCSDLIPFPYENPPCEIEVLTKLQANERCHPVLFDIEDYNVQKLKSNKWIVITKKQLPITQTCPFNSPKTIIIDRNSIFTMKPKCSAFIGTIQIHAQEDKTTNHSESEVIPSVYYDCCENMVPSQHHQLKPLKINTLNLDDLKTAEFKLNQYKDQLDKLGNEPFAHRHLSTFAVITIVIISALLFYITCFKCGLLKGLIGYFTGSRPNDGPPRPGRCCPQIFNYCNIRSNVSRRPSIHIEADDHSEEIVYQRAIPLTPIPTKRRL